MYKKWWTGINIEPNYIMYKKLIKQRKKDINLNLGVWTWEEMVFYLLDNHVLSTFDKKTANDYIKMWHKILDQKKIQTLPLEKIFDKYVWKKTIDILSVDVEWYDMEVLKTNNRDKYKPTYIILETLEYKKDWTWEKNNKIYDNFLLNKWYKKISDTYINSIYKLK